MIRVAVVDDEPLARQGVVQRLAGHGDLQLEAQYADGHAALQGLQAQPPDLVFIDVQMPGMSGLEVLAALPDAQRPLAVLLTAHEGFAVKAFALNAVDYLLKPIDEERFDEALARVRERLAWRAGGDAVVPPKAWPLRLAVRVGRRERFVRVRDIDWIEADGDYACLHVAGQQHLLRESLQALSLRLDPTQFVRVHRSAMVQVDRVAEMQPLSNRDALLRLRDGTPLRVSRSHVDALLAQLHRHASAAR